MLIDLKFIKYILFFLIVYWIWTDSCRWHKLLNNNTCCLSYTDNIMPTDALATLEPVRQQAWYWPHKSGLFRLPHQDSWHMIYVVYDDSIACTPTILVLCEKKSPGYPWIPLTKVRKLQCWVIFFDGTLKKLPNKQSRYMCFETWSSCGVTIIINPWRYKDV